MAVFLGPRHADWASRQPSQRSQDDDALTAHIEQIHGQYRQAAGILKTQTVLLQRGIEDGKHRIARLRHMAGIETRRKKRFRVMRSYQRSEPAAPDLVHRVVGWAMAIQATSDLAIAALTMAIQQRRPKPGLIFPQPQGGQNRHL